MHTMYFDIKDKKVLQKQQNSSISRDIIHIQRCYSLMTEQTYQNSSSQKKMYKIYWEVNMYFNRPNIKFLMPKAL